MHICLSVYVSYDFLFMAFELNGTKIVDNSTSDIGKKVTFVLNFILYCVQLPCGNGTHMCLRLKG